MKCGQLIQIQQSDEYDKFCYEQEELREQKSNNTQISNYAKCPYCSSNNTTKISTANRVVSSGLFGLGSKKIGKLWHCNHYKSDF